MLSCIVTVFVGLYFHFLVFFGKRKMFCAFIGSKHLYFQCHVLVAHFHNRIQSFYQKQLFQKSRIFLMFGCFWSIWFKNKCTKCCISIESKQTSLAARLRSFQHGIEVLLGWNVVGWDKYIILFFWQLELGHVATW